MRQIHVRQVLRALLAITLSGSYATIVCAADDSKTESTDPRGAQIAAPPLEFKGLTIGSSDADLRAKYPELHCNDPRQKAATEKGHFKDFWERKQTEADIFCATAISERGPRTELSEIAGHRATAFDFNFFGNQLMRASASLPSPAFDDLVTALSARYGPADKKETEEVQNRAGAKFLNIIMHWNRDNATLRVAKYAGSLDKSSYSLTSDEYWQQVEKRRGARARDAAKSL